MGSEMCIRDRPRPVQGRAPGKEGSKVAQTPTGQHREADQKIREEARGGAQPKKLPGSRWGDSQRALILERCDTELRRLEDYVHGQGASGPPREQQRGGALLRRRQRRPSASQAGTRTTVPRNSRQDGMNTVSGRGRLHMGTRAPTEGSRTSRTQRHGSRTPIHPGSP